MAYITGTANSINELLTAIQNACTANGWTLAGNVLYRNGCYVELKLSGTWISIAGGTGIDGSNALTGRSNRGVGYLGISMKVYQGNPSLQPKPVAFGWPVTYFIHLFSNPDEVYVVVNYAVSYYQQLAFGKSTMPGLNGSGNWYIGVWGDETNTYPYGGIFGSGEYGYGTGSTSLFCRYYDYGSASGVDNGFETNGWVHNNAFHDCMPLLLRQPNQWNGESILIPIRVYAQRPSGYYSPVLECVNARFVNIRSLTDQQIITLGSERWRVYPWFVRSTKFSTGSSSDGSWYAGHAIRYDGP